MMVKKLKKHDGNRASARSQCISAVPVLELKPERSVIPWESYPLIFPFIFDDGLNRETGKDVLVKILWALQNKTILYTTMKYFNNICCFQKCLVNSTQFIYSSRKQPDGVVTESLTIYSKTFVSHIQLTKEIVQLSMCVTNKKIPRVFFLPCLNWNLNGVLSPKI